MQLKQISEWVNKDDMEVLLSDEEIKSWLLEKGPITKRIKLNITAVYNSSQTEKILKVIGKKTNVIISIFAGRSADVGKDPVPEFKKSILMAKNYKNVITINKNKLDLLINDENLRKELSRNISRMGLPNASSDIVEIIKKHFNDEL